MCLIYTSLPDQWSAPLPYGPPSPASPTDAGQAGGMATTPNPGHPRKRRGGPWPVDPQVSRDQPMSIQPCYWCGPFLPKPSRSPCIIGRTSWICWRVRCLVNVYNFRERTLMKPGSSLIILIGIREAINLTPPSPLACFSHLKL